MIKKITELFSILLFCLFGCKCKEEKKPEQQTTINKQPEQVTELEKKLKENPDSANVRLELVNVLDSIGDYKKAIAQMDILTKKDSKNQLLWFKKGELLEDAKDTAGAIAAYAQAIKLYPSADALLKIANLYAETKNSRSLLICNQVQKMKLGREYDAHCYYIAGIYNARIGDKIQAIQLFDKCISNNYTYMEAYMEKGIVYFDNNQYEDALKVFQFASTVNNLYADAYYYQARCYELLGKADSAVMRFKQSLSLDKNLKEATEGLKRLNALQ